jgi:hypothetical protein
MSDALLYQCSRLLHVKQRSYWNNSICLVIRMIKLDTSTDRLK